MEKIKSCLTLTLLMVILLSFNIQASELSLDDCIELALQNRASIIIARGSEDLAKAGKRAALGAFLPNISANYRSSESKQRDIKTGSVGGPEFELPDQDGSSKGLSISGNIYLFNLSNFYNYAAAGAEQAKAELDVINSEHDLIYSVKLSFYAYLAFVEDVDVQEEAVKRSEEQLKLINSRYELGSASLSDVLKQKVQFGNDRLALLGAGDAVVTSKATLAYTIGMDPNSDIEFSKNYSNIQYEGSLNEAIDYALTNEPGLLASKKSVDGANHSVGSAMSRYLPYATASLSYSKLEGTSGDTLLFDFSSKTTSYGFNINWNIFDGFQREREITSAKVSQNNARALEAETRNLVIRDVKTAYFDIEQQNQAKEIAQDNVEAANEDLKISQEKYKLGAATILDLLDAQVSLKRAQVSLIRADFDLNLAVSKLENAMGK